MPEKGEHAEKELRKQKCVGERAGVNVPTVRGQVQCYATDGKNCACVVKGVCGRVHRVGKEGRGAEKLPLQPECVRVGTEWASTNGKGGIESTG